jgi:RNA polymerase sigma factor (sigma-70 family)
MLKTGANACFLMETVINIKDLQQRIAVYEDETAYKLLFFQLFPSLQNFAYSIVKSRELAEEIASDALISVWVRRALLMNIENLKLYLFISVKNAAVKKVNLDKKRGQNLQLDDLSVEFISEYGNPADAAQANETERKIKSVVKELPPRCQLIYKLAKEENLKYKEISELLNLSIKTIDNQLAIAIKRISAVVNFSKAGK